MAAGSERFAFARFPGVPRECAVCSCWLKLADVARVHSEVGDVAGVGVVYHGFLLQGTRARGVGVNGSPAERLGNPNVVRPRSDLAELGWSRRGVDAIMRGCPVIVAAGVPPDR